MKKVSVECGWIGLATEKVDISTTLPPKFYRDNTTRGIKMKKIKLTQGKFALVDDADFDWLNQWNWYAQKHQYGNFRAMRSRGSRKNHQVLYMHRVIMDAPKGIDVDHRNLNTLDNQRDNLRLATRSQNLQNTRKRPNKSSKYKGVSWHNIGKKWQARIAINKKALYLGLFESEMDAAKEYNACATKYFGEFARINNV
jgi:hypothetical protein